MNARTFPAIGGGLLLLGSTGCPAPCLDDGLLQDAPDDCLAATAGESETETTMLPEGSSGEEPDPPCANGVLDDGEADVDCGGSCPQNACGDGDDCGSDDDCASNTCSADGQCIRPSCDNGVGDGDETDIDCGGSCPDGCGGGQGCSGDEDCESGSCESGTCGTPADPTCDDEMQNGDETGVDCGGSCRPCGDRAECVDGDDCDSGVCEDDVCQDPSCDDAVRNGDETGLDCGGESCEACPPGDGCDDAADCDSGICDRGVCQDPSCDDGVQNGDETDVDCGGGLCEGCDPGQTCDEGDDCLSAGCVEGTCSALLSVAAGPACGDASGGSVALSATAMGGTGGPYSYSWAPDDGSLDTPDQADTNASPTGFATYTVTADDGTNTAQDTVVVIDSDPFDLEDNCTLYTGAFGGNAASITYDMGGTRACEAGNNGFGLHLCEGVVFENTQLTGRIEVTEDTGDDDWIGLVWGAQDDANFYSLVWKRQPQDIFGCTASAGILVKRIEAPSFAEIAGADMYCPQDTDDSTVLALPAATTIDGWAEATQYDIVIDYTTTGSEITVTPVGGGPDVASFTIADDAFPSGAFGSTTNSQANACVGPLFGACLPG